ncbi:putative uncharacterized protein DDB_G0268338 [Condylostylus longicornis]|uniref:putative uncharacterized protein DDB_G0268338 n=1 Tax=Condylostylus longicornis TaxID=2530218 RepID=UPI00244DB859|nr:putative uncharacterized protein DDB_G0268338 [Condylostylus longicornis]
MPKEKQKSRSERPLIYEIPKKMALNNNNNVNNNNSVNNNRAEFTSEKFEFDSRKPQEFNPKINESVILKSFLNNIDTNITSVIINKNIENLREVYNTLVNLNLFRDKNSNNITKYDNHFLLLLLLRVLGY